MNLLEITNELRDLGFEEDATMTEYEEIKLNAINRATWLAFDTVVIPLKGWYKRELTTTTESTVETIYEHVEDGLKKTVKTTETVTKGSGKPSVTETISTEIIADDGKNHPNTIETASWEDTWYPIRPSVLKVGDPDGTEIGIPDNLLRPVALLTAHYLWLDDDEVKAVYYYNEWETFVKSIMDACMQDMSAKITGGIRI